MTTKTADFPAAYLRQALLGRCRLPRTPLPLRKAPLGSSSLSKKLDARLLFFYNFRLLCNIRRRSRARRFFD